MAVWHRTAADQAYFLHLRTAPISAGSLREINPLETSDGPSTAFARVWSASCAAGQRGLRHTSEAAARLRTAVSTASRSRTSRATRLLERPLYLGSCRKGFAGSKGGCGSTPVLRLAGKRPFPEGLRLTAQAPSFRSSRVSSESQKRVVCTSSLRYRIQRSSDVDSARLPAGVRPSASNDKNCQHLHRDTKACRDVPHPTNVS